MLLLFTCILLGFGLCHAGAIAPRVIGGVPAWNGQFPFSAAIYVTTTTSKFFCGGALLTSDSVLTSGHCALNAVSFTIQLGSIYLEGVDNERVVVATSEYIIHPDFNPDTLEHDIAIIRFRMSIQYSTYLAPVTIWEIDVRDYDYVSAVGWGQISDTNATLSGQLLYVLINTISNAECRAFYGAQVTDNMVCAIGNYNQGTCIGDNGGPLAVNFGKYYQIAGIASFISGDGCESMYPSGYTRTHPYREWIYNITAQT